MKQVAPSFLSADIWQAAAQVQALEEAGCRYLHLDIMDGHFVPNISFGPGWVKWLRPHSAMVFDAHLMVEEPDFLLESFAKAGADYLTVHVEAVRHLDRTVARIRDLGMRPGVALNPTTSLTTLDEVLPLVDLALIMSVNPGTPAEKAGLRQYDFITAVNGQRVTSVRELTTILDTFQTGDTVTLTVVRYNNAAIVNNNYNNGNYYGNFPFGFGYGFGGFGNYGGYGYGYDDSNSGSANNGTLTVGGGYTTMDIDVTLEVLEN